MHLLNFQASNAKLELVIGDQASKALLSVELDLSGVRISQTKSFPLFAEDAQRLSSVFRSVLEIGPFPYNRPMAFEPAELRVVPVGLGAAQIRVHRKLEAGRFAVFVTYAPWAFDQPSETQRARVACGEMLLGLGFTVAGAELDHWAQNLNSLIPRLPALP